MVGLRLGIICLLLVGVLSRTWTNKEKKELNKKYWRTVLDLFETEKSTDEDEANEFLKYYSDQKLILMNEETVASWNYSTNITDYNDLLSQQASGKLANFESETILLASRFDAQNFSDDIKRQFQRVGSKSLDWEDMKEMGELKSKMRAIYAKAKVCLA